MRLSLRAFCFTGALFAALPASAQSNIKLGLIDGYSSSFSFAADAMRTGFMIAVDEANAAGGLNGRKFEVVNADMAAQVDKAVTEARRMILDEKIRFVTVGIHSGAGVAVSNLGKENKVLVSVGFATTRRLTGELGHPLVARASFTTVESSRIAAEFLKDRPNVKRISVVNPDYEYGQQWMQDFVVRLKVVRPDITIVREEWPRLGTTDYSPHVTAMQAQPVDLVMLNLSGTDIVNFLKSAQDFGLFTDKMEMYTVSPDLVKYAPLKELLPKNSYAQLWFPYQAIDSEVTKNFAREVEKRSNTYATASSPVGYIAARMLIEAIRKAGTADDAEAVAKALGTVEFEGPTGAVKVRACDNMVMTNTYVGRLTRDAASPDGVRVVDVKTYRTEDIARTCEEITKLRTAAQK